MSLLSLLRREEQSAIDAAWRRYAALLENDKGDASDLAQLKQVMQTLGKSAADAEGDAKTLQAARECLPIIRGGAGLEAKRTEAHQATLDFDAETQRIIIEREKALIAIQDIEGDLARRWMASNASARQLEGMRQRAPRLLEHIETPDNR